MVEDTHTSHPTSPADALRRAAALMRERATAARAGRWFADGPDVLAQWEYEARYIGTCDAVPSPDGNVLNADHIASWHPVVALAVADVLDDHACNHDAYECGWAEPCAPVRLARAYLGGES